MVNRIVRDSDRVNLATIVKEDINYRRRCCKYSVDFTCSSAEWAQLETLYRAFMAGIASSEAFLAKVRAKFSKWVKTYRGTRLLGIDTALRDDKILKRLPMSLRRNKKEYFRTKDKLVDLRYEAYWLYRLFSTGTPDGFYVWRLNWLQNEVSTGKCGCKTFCTNRIAAWQVNALRRTIKSNLTTETQRELLTRLRNAIIDNPIPVNSQDGIRQPLMDGQYDFALSRN